jgi:transaldolase
VRSVASLFVSRWDKATMEKLPANLRNKLGIAVGQQSFRAYRQLMATDRWQRLMNLGARPQRLLFASTGVKDPAAPDTMYVTALAAPNTVNTMPEETLLAFSDHGSLTGALGPDGGNCEQVLAAISAAGVDLSALAAQLQTDGAESFNASWKNLLKSIETKSKALK